MNARSPDAAKCQRCGSTVDSFGFCRCEAGPTLPLDFSRVAATTTEWDEWLSLFANRNEVAEEYASWLRAYGADWQQASKFNEAILRRWSPAGLRYIKERAWNGH